MLYERYIKDYVMINELNCSWNPDIGINFNLYIQRKLIFFSKTKVHKISKYEQKVKGVVTEEYKVIPYIYYKSARV